MTRILHVHRDFAPDRGGGGVARHIHGLAEIASQQGFDVRVVAPAAQPPHDEHAYDVQAAGIFGLWRHVGWADVVHVHGARNPIAAAAAAMAGSRGKRVIYTPHCYYDDGGTLKRAAKRAWDEMVERRLLARCDPVVLLADFWLDALGARGLSVQQPMILPNCVPEMAVLSRPAAPQRLEGAPSLLSVGRLDRVKRLDDAIRALNESGLASAVLHIVGLGPDRARLEGVVAQAGVASRVRFHGFVPDAELAAMAAAADCFVLPSSAEGGPTVLIEMLLLGCKVVASDIPGNRVILEAAGWQQGLYALGDVSALARTSGRVAAQTMPPDVRERVRKAFTWEQKRSQIVSLYQARDATPPIRDRHDIMSMQDASMSCLGCPLGLAGRQNPLHRTQSAGTLSVPRLRIESLNVAKLVAAQTDTDLMGALRQSAIVHVDGQGIAFGLAMRGIPAERGAGIDLVRTC